MHFIDCTLKVVHRRAGAPIATFFPIQLLTRAYYGHSKAVDLGSSRGPLEKAPSDVSGPAPRDGLRSPDMKRFRLVCPLSGAGRSCQGLPALPSQTSRHWPNASTIYWPLDHNSFRAAMHARSKKGVYQETQPAGHASSIAPSPLPPRRLLSERVCHVLSKK